MQSRQSLPWVELQGVELRDETAAKQSRWAACRRLLLPVSLLATCLSFGSLPAVAQTNLVTNGTFQTTGSSTSFQFGTFSSNNNPYTPLGTVTGWSSTGYNYVFLGSQTSATGTYGNFSLWGANNTNGLVTSAPTGGNYLALDGDYGNGTAPVTQTINGLTVGATYVVSFAWAGAQQYNFTGATTDNLTVSLGTAPSKTTQTINVANHGFSGWMTQSFSFLANSSSAVLSFLAAGSPAQPPFVLLANVSVTKAPEPASAALLTTGFLGLAAIAAKRRRSGFARRQVV